MKERKKSGASPVGSLVNPKAATSGVNVRVAPRRKGDNLRQMAEMMRVVTGEVVVELTFSTDVMNAGV